MHSLVCPCKKIYFSYHQKQTRRHNTITWRNIINQNVATIFTPRIDKATILCNHLPAETSILNVGINFIQQYANCTIATSEFKTTNEAIQITLAIFLMLLVFSFCRFCCTPCGAYTLKCLPKKCIKTTCYSIVICLERMHLA